MTCFIPHILHKNKEVWNLILYAWPAGALRACSNRLVEVELKKMQSHFCYKNERLYAERSRIKPLGQTLKTRYRTSLYPIIEVTCLGPPG